MRFVARVGLLGATGLGAFLCAAALPAVLRQAFPLRLALAQLGLALRPRPQQLTTALKDHSVPGLPHRRGAVVGDLDLAEEPDAAIEPSDSAQDTFTPRAVFLAPPHSPYAALIVPEGGGLLRASCGLAARGPPAHPALPLGSSSRPLPPATPSEKEVGICPVAGRHTASGGAAP